LCAEGANHRGRFSLQLTLAPSHRPAPALKLGVPPGVHIFLYLRCTESPCIARLHPSFRLPHAPADCCTPIRRCRPLLPPFSSTQQTPLPLHHPRLLLPSLNVGGAITPPPSHHLPVAAPTVYAAAPGIALGPDRLRPSPRPSFWNHGRSSRGQSHDVEVHTVGGP
jgi:hypothetical protein